MKHAAPTMHRSGPVREYHPAAPDPSPLTPATPDRYEQLCALERLLEELGALHEGRFPTKDPLALAFGVRWLYDRGVRVQV